MSGCPCRVGVMRGPGPECENVSALVCVSLVWVGCGCLLLRLDLVWILPPSLVLTPLHTPPHSKAGTACLLSSHCNWNLPCLFQEFGKEEEEAGRQTDRPPTL